MKRPIISAFLVADTVVILAFLCWWQPWRSNVQTDSEVVEQNVNQPLSLIDRFESARQQNDVEAIFKLICWDGVDEFTAESVKASISSDSKKNMVSVSFEPCDKQPASYELRGVTYQPNLPVEGHLVLEYMVDGATSWSKYLVGSKDGVQWIATAAPIKEN